MAAVTLGSPDQPAPAREKSGAAIRFLADPEGHLADALGLRHRGGNPANGADTARPATLIVHRNGTVLGATCAENYRVRPDPDAILEAVRTAPRQADTGAAGAGP